MVCTRCQLFTDPALLNADSVCVHCEHDLILHGDPSKPVPEGIIDAPISDDWERSEMRRETAEKQIVERGGKRASPNPDGTLMEGMATRLMFDNIKSKNGLIHVSVPKWDGGQFVYEEELGDYRVRVEAPTMAGLWALYDEHQRRMKERQNG